MTGSSMMAGLFELHAMAYVLPSAKCELELTTAEQGFTYAVGTFGFALSSHFWGFLADTWGRQKVLKCSLILCAISSAISSLSVTSWMLMLSRFCVGLW